jgi:hypothetical protein
MKTKSQEKVGNLTSLFAVGANAIVILVDYNAHFLHKSNLFFIIVLEIGSHDGNWCRMEKGTEGIPTQGKKLPQKRQLAFIPKKEKLDHHEFPSHTTNRLAMAEQCMYSQDQQLSFQIYER